MKNRIGDIVKIIQNHYKLERDFRQIIRKQRYNLFQVHTGQFQKLQCFLSGFRKDRLQSGNQVGKKACWVIVTNIQRNPSGGPAWLACQPLYDQGGFSGTSWRRDQAHLVAWRLDSI